MPTLAEDVQSLVTKSRTHSERTIFAQTKLGVSDIGHCREYVRRILLDEPREQVTTQYDLAALVGTAVGRELEILYVTHINPDALIQEEVTVQFQVTINGKPWELNIPGHPDVIDKENDRLVDWKGLALDTRIPTPSGWTTMGQLRIGDLVFDASGQAVPVTGKSEVKNLRCYQVTVAGGHSVICDEEHLWLAQRGFRSTATVIPVAQLRRGDFIPVTEALDLSSVDLPVDPWLLGYWLGNGSSAASVVTTHGDDAEQVSRIVAALGYSGTTRRDRHSNAASVSLAAPRLRRADGRMIESGFHRAMIELGTTERKRIPDLYLRSSASQRLALLRGLMDSDGTWNTARHRAVFSSTTSDLADDVAELARSLGERVQTHTHQKEGFGLTVTEHTVEWTPRSNPFALDRKAGRVVLADDAGPTRHRLHRVESVELVESVPTQCISVDSPTRTYLCGEAMLPTHNTEDGVGAIRSTGSKLQQIFQVSLYADAAIKRGWLTPNCTVALVHFDRSGREPEPVIEEWTFDPSIVEQAFEWLNDVLYAIANGEETSRDIPRSMCFAICPFATACRTDTDVEGLIEDPFVLNAIKVYKESGAIISAAEKDRKSALSLLTDVEGRTPEWTLRWTTIPGGDVAYARKPYRRLDINPNRPAKRSKTDG